MLEISNRGPSAKPLTEADLVRLARTVRIPEANKQYFTSTLSRYVDDAWKHFFDQASKSARLELAAKGSEQLAGIKKAALEIAEADEETIAKIESRIRDLSEENIDVRRVAYLIVMAVSEPSNNITLISEQVEDGRIIDVVQKKPDSIKKRVGRPKNPDIHDENLPYQDEFIRDIVCLVIECGGDWTHDKTHHAGTAKLFTDEIRAFLPGGFCQSWSDRRIHDIGKQSIEHCRNKS
jgi:hypothetical protein